jgi:hypothetical protein
VSALVLSILVLLRSCDSLLKSVRKRRLFVVRNLELIG